MRKPHGREWSWVVLVGVLLLVAALALTIYFISLASKQGRPRASTGVVADAAWVPSEPADATSRSPRVLGVHNFAAHRE
jgi:hypothetical protein